MEADAFADHGAAGRPTRRRRVRPLYALLAALALGVLVAPRAPVPAPFLLAAMGLLLGAAALLGRYRRVAAALCLLAAFALFGALRQGQAANVAPDDVSGYANRPSLWVFGEVASGVTDRPGRTGEADQYAFTLRARAVDDYARTRGASGLLRVTLFGADAAPRAGDALWLRGRVEIPPAATNPGGFDDRAYLARHEAYAVMAVKRAADVRRAGRVPLPLAAAASALRGRAEERARAHLAPGDAALLLGMLAGERGRLPADVEDAFARTGTMHLLTVSGLHVAVAAGMLAWALGALTVPRKANRALCLVAVWAFALAAGGGAVSGDLRAPALRAALCASVFLAAPLVRRTAEPRHALAFAALVLLLADPLALWDPGAQLTFATVGALAWWMPPLERLVAPWEPGTGRLRRLCRVAALGLTGGIVAQAGSWPLAATYFHLFSPVAPLANLVLAPLASALFGLGLLLAAVPALPLWGVLASGLHALRLLALSFAAPDWAARSVAAPPAAFVVAYYVALFALAAVVRARVLVPRRLFAPPPPPRS